MNVRKTDLFLTSRSCPNSLLFFMTLKKLFIFTFLFLSEIAFLPSAAAEETVSISKTPRVIDFSWIGGGKKIATSEEINSWFEKKETISFSGKTETEALSPDSCPWWKEFCDFSLLVEQRFSIRSETLFVFREDAAILFLEDLRQQTRQDPINALFAVDENNTVSTFAPGRDGLEIDVQSGLDALKTALIHSSETTLSIPLPSTSIQPDIAETDANRLGINVFLGEGRTNFSGSPKNRIFNIHRAVEEFQGALIAPQEEFSFVDRLGPVDGENGYLPELVIKRGETLPEFGGGICQVSTTLFRAALNTGQKITERRNHAYPVQYYKPYGMDATIYIPKPDFKFVNNTPAHILIQASIEEQELIFRFYGTTDKRTVTIDGPHITSRTPDGGMKTVFTQTVIAADGSTLIEDVFKSSYESPSKYPHPGEERLVEKPKNWSEKQWDAYVTTGTLPR